MGVVDPDLLARIERIIRHANDKRTAPIGFAGNVAIIGGIDWGETGVGIAKDIDSLVGVAVGVRATRVFIIQYADEAVCRQNEERTWASFALHGDEVAAVNGAAGSSLHK